MKCPYCNHEETKVIDSRETNDLSEIRRRRECLSCTKRFTTYEVIDFPELFVIKSDGSRELFDRSKIFRGVVKACDKRPITPEAVENFVRDVETKIRTRYDREIKSKLIGQIISKKLYKFDVVAYIRFVSVYQKFSDINSFMAIVRKVVEDDTRDASTKEQISKLLQTASELITSQS
ncbi:transcriptional repressor NrdR [Candidatus Woesearchaeota archaeon]|nr:transcriptional repressor NrdR [Candidatus Woesearchaeota archaeon]